MEPILDETSLVPCIEWSPGRRIRALADALVALDALGAPRVLRSVRDAVDRAIFQEQGLRRWCFDRSGAVDREAGLLIATRLSRPPFIDGEEGLFAAAEGDRAIEARLGDQEVYALGLAALEGLWAHSFGSASAPEGGSVNVALHFLDEEEDWTEEHDVRRIVLASEVNAAEQEILERLDASVANGPDLLARAHELFPRIQFGPRAMDQITALGGAEPVFRQLLRHLRALDRGAAQWEEGVPFEPVGGLSWSVESGTTLQHGSYGPMRDFPVPEGYPQERWSLHTKLTGGNAARMYFRPVRGEEGGPVVLIGYFGLKLPTVKYPT